MPPDAPTPPVVVIDKNKAERVHVTLSSYKGARLIDVRTYYTDAKGEVRATQRASPCASPSCLSCARVPGGRSRGDPPRDPPARGRGMT